MSTQEVIASAQAVIEEIKAAEEKKDKAIADLWADRQAIDQALEALGVDPNAAKPKRVRKALSDESRQRMSAAQRKRFEKGGGLQGTNTT